ncbi:hypothetical protein CJD36_016230 [Flavipsychrobacter stenotrophus]|uniref:Peptidase M28 domain-containing protein n=1 Tax=Flavipsychrobacter stenotrophus TaxID=2077091 RepID=A0A2S7SUF8_9BACT|nr:M28 family peptidase [Flavipsychrobacter stenotrophus]PQJ10235.1 hypothetical protein CJD36_016230 [Flavipsychrobacter stenotrophus]
MKQLLLLLSGIFFLFASQGTAQTAITCSDTIAAQVMMGNYDPAAFMATAVINDHNSISNGIHSGVSADTLHSYLSKLQTFYTRNSASDTVSNTIGIGAARRWVLAKFKQIGAQNDNRLRPCYLQFDQLMCTVNQHRNIMAVLPGMDTSDRSIIIIEGHIDSRSADLCDTAIVAQGMEDNATGTALVIELARVMSRYSYNHTIVFMVTIGEEQGLYGAQAFVNYANLHGIKIKAVLNNDVIGGVICGHTSSAPSCSGEGTIDSTHVRLFSSGGFNSFHKGLARYIKLEYNERILPTAAMPMGISIMTPADRTGRGGDHIPFHNAGFTAMRFTAANESGDANVTDTAYHDRQHTSRDSLGLDTNGDGIYDSFYVDFNYLARNTIINGNVAGMIAISPAVPDFTMTSGIGSFTVNITTHPEYLHYKVGVRTTTYDWDSVYEFSGAITQTIAVPAAGTYEVSVASVDANGVESMFSKEIMKVVGVENIAAVKPAVELLQNKPNPSDEATMISVVVSEAFTYREAYIDITDLNGKLVERKPVTLNTGVNELLYEHGYHASGTYVYTLVIDNVKVQSKKMVFVN